MVYFCEESWGYSQCCPPNSGTLKPPEFWDFSWDFIGILFFFSWNIWGFHRDIAGIYWVYILDC